MGDGTKVVRCAVHGDIDLEPEALRLLDTFEMQRLRGIKQLGTASLVYPSAVHTRFEHALGTYHLAARLLERIARRGGGPRPLSAPERKAVRLAALVHDVTHVPYGHTFEDERRIWARHDSPEHVRAFLRAGELGEALAATGLAGLVEAILIGRPPLAVMAEVVRGAVGADLLDYLARDARGCGFARCWDERLLRYYRMAPEGGLALEVYKRGMLRPDAVSEILQLLWLRYTLCERVYYHHAKIAAGAMISRALEAALDAGLRRADLQGLRDDELPMWLRERFGALGVVRRLLELFARRRLHKRVYVLTREIGEAAQRALVERLHLDRRAREEAERVLAEAAGLEPADVIVYCPEPRMASKEVDVRVCGEAVASRSLRALRLPEVELLLERHRDLWRLYVFLAADRMDRAARVAAAARACFDHDGAVGG